MIVLIYLVIILLFGLFNKIDLYNSFINGVKSSLQDIVSIIAPIVAITLSVQIFLNSGIDQILDDILPLRKIPVEVVLQSFLKPISNNASLIVMMEIYEKYDINSSISYLSSLLQGCSDTTFYVVTLYFTASKVKNSKYALKSALINDLLSFIITFIIWKLMFNNI